MCCDCGPNWSTTIIKHHSYIFVSLVLVITTMTPIMAEIYIFHRYFKEGSRSLFWMTPFYVLVLSIYINYYCCLTTGPGLVKDLPKQTVSKSNKVPEKDIKLAKTRWCSKCLANKPKRAHHCSICDVCVLKMDHHCPWVANCIVCVLKILRVGAIMSVLESNKPKRAHHRSICDICVLKMDHHCPWVANCIGYRNYPHFVRFLGSIVSSVMYCFFLTFMRIYDTYQYHNDLDNFHRGINRPIRYTPPVDASEVVGFLLVMIICCILMLIVGILLLTHLYYISRNVSTIEDSENSSIYDMQARDNLVIGVYPYDLGIYKNLCAVFGERWYLWWWPSGGRGDGVVFEKANNDVWPPREYYLKKKYPYGKDKGNGISVQGSRRVRRGSEGFLVPMLTEKDREDMVNGTYKEYVADVEMVDSSTDFDSDPESEKDSDDELLGDRKKRI